MEGNMQFSTPRKSIKRGKQQVCVACAKASADARNLSNSPSKKKGLVSLLFRYGGVNISEGYLCRTCETRLLKWDREINIFKIGCLQNIHVMKRQATSPIIYHDKRICDKHYRDSIVTSRQLFADDDSNLNLHSHGNSIVMPRQLFTVDKSNNLYCQDVECNSAVKPALSEKSIQLAPVVENSVSEEYELGFLYDSQTYVSNDVSTFIAEPSVSFVPTNMIKDSVRVNEELDVIAQVNTETEDNFKNQNMLSLSEETALKQLVDRKNVSQIATFVLKNEKLRNYIIELLIENIRAGTKTMTSKSYRSQFRSGNYDSLAEFDWDYVYEEYLTRNEISLKFMLAVISDLNIDKCVKGSNVRKRICTAYAILLQGRSKQMSAVQRLVTSVLMDSICDKKVTIRCYL